MSFVTRLIQRLRNPGFRKPILRQRCHGKARLRLNYNHDRCGRLIDLTDKRRYCQDWGKTFYYQCDCGRLTLMIRSYAEARIRGFETPDAYRRFLGQQ